MSDDTAPKEANVTSSKVDSKKQDAAGKYLQDHADNAAADSVDLKKLRAKIDWNIVPLMFLCYFLQFIDKVIINVSANWESHAYES